MDENIEKRKRLYRDLWIIWWIQVVSAVVAVCAFVLYTGNFVPNVPEWDGVHLMCGATGLICSIGFTITTIWGSVKYSPDYLDASMTSWSISIYEASLCVVIPFVCLLTPPQMAPVPYAAWNMFYWILAFTVLYCIVPQYFVVRTLSKKLKIL